MLFTTQEFLAAEAAYRQDRIRTEFAKRSLRRAGRRVRPVGRRGLHRRHSVATSS